MAARALCPPDVVKLLAAANFLAHPVSDKARGIWVGESGVEHWPVSVGYELGPQQREADTPTRLLALATILERTCNVRQLADRLWVGKPGIPPGVLASSIRSCALSPDGVYRYQLGAVWNPEKPCVLFTLLNPSKADAKTDDPTWLKCCGYAWRWGWGGVQIGNAYGLRATDPAELRRAADPVGSANDEHLARLRDACPLVVFGWGSHINEARNDRAREIRQLWHAVGAPKPTALALTKGGQPGHPLYLPYCLKPRPIGELRVTLTDAEWTYLSAPIT